MADSTLIALLLALIATGGANVVGPIIKGWIDRRAGRNKVTEAQITTDEVREARLMRRIETLEKRVDDVIAERDEARMRLAEALGRIASLEAMMAGEG